MGVTPFYKRFEHDGARGPNIARSTAIAATASVSVVFYNRSNEAAAQLKPGDFDWARSSAPASGGFTAAASSHRSPKRPRS